MEKKLEYVKKRNGRTVPFDKQKISDAIFKAAQSVGGQDRYLADDLAEVVRMYLVSEYKGDAPSVEDIQDVVERILIKTGHAKTAKAYILYRQKRARVRKIREGFTPEDLSEREHERTLSGMEVTLPVRRSDDNVSLWDKNRIVAALVRETAIPENIAELIVIEVEEEIVASKIRRLSSSLIRELVNTKLVQYGFEEERRKHARLGMPFYDVKKSFESFTGVPDELSREFGRAVKREFAMNAVLPDAAVERHLRGEIVIHNIEGIDRCYSARISGGLSADKMQELVKETAPFTEQGVVISLPDGVPLSLPRENEIRRAGAFSLEVPLATVKEEFIRSAAQRKIPLSFKIRAAEEVDRLGSFAGSLVTVSPAGSGSGALVMNRVALDLSMSAVYAEHEGLPVADYISGLIPLFSDILKRQITFISASRFGNKLLANFGEDELTLEVEFRDAFSGAGDFIAGEAFINKLLDERLSFVAEISSEKGAADRLFACLRTFLEQSQKGGRKISVRVADA